MSRIPVLAVDIGETVPAFLKRRYGVQPFPDWLADFELKFVGLKSFGQVKEAYIKHFGNPLANTEMVELSKPELKPITTTLAKLE